MDGSHVDTLAKALSEAHSRRGLTRLLGRLALICPLALVARSEADAKRKPKSKKKACPPCKKRKRGKCKVVLPDGTACPGGSCQGGSCLPTPLAASCPVGQKPCRGSCIPSNQCCTDDDCPSAAPDCCGDACVNTSKDVRNCGSCGAPCAYNEQCQAGACLCEGTRACSARDLGGWSCCAAGVCICRTDSFHNALDCTAVAQCPAGTFPCTAATDNCVGGPAKTCCPIGTTCDPEGSCRYA